VDVPDLELTLAGKLRAKITGVAVNASPARILVSSARTSGAES